MTSRRKIDLVAVDSSEPVATSQSAHVWELAAALAESGHDVTLWARRDRTEHPRDVATDQGVTVRRVDAGPARRLPPDELLPYLPPFAAAVRSAWADEPPQVAHAHSWTSGLVTLAAAREQSVPVVMTFHGLRAERRSVQDGRTDRRSAQDGRTGRWSRRGRAEHHLAHNVDRIVAASSDERDQLLTIGVPRRRVTVVAPGVDARTFSPAGHTHPRGDRPRIVTLGSLARGSGVEEGIVALAAVPEAELVVAGGAGPGDPDVARLRALAGACRTGTRVRFVGPVPHTEVPALLRSADVVLCVPWHEPLGGVVLAAMACGRPVVASAVGVPAEAVVDGMTGLLVPPRRPRETAAALRHILSSPTAAIAMGVAGRDRAEQRYGWARAAHVTSETYAEFSRDPAPRPAVEATG